MGLGVKNLSLSFDVLKTIYYPGDVIEGFCNVEIERNVVDSIPGFAVRCRGIVKAHWTEHSGKSSKSYSESHDILQLEQTYTIYNYGEFSPGSTHQLPFRFQLPKNTLFTSVEFAYGYIRYWIEAECLASSWLFDNKVKVQFMTLQLIDTNIPQYRFPVCGRDKKNVGCFCWKSGPVFIEAQTDRAAYCPNEIITITATFRNNSNKNVKPYVKLLEKRYFQAEGHETMSSHEHSLTAVDGDDERDETKNVIVEGACTTWNGMRFRLPALVPSVNCGIIMVTYRIEIGLDIPWAYDLEVYLPIVIGTIPYLGSSLSLKPSSPVEGSGSNLPLCHLNITGSQWTGLGRRASKKALLENGYNQPRMPPLLPPSEGSTHQLPSYYFDSFLHAQQPILDCSSANNQTFDQKYARTAPRRPSSLIQSDLARYQPSDLTPRIPTVSGRDFCGVFTNGTFAPKIRDEIRNDHQEKQRNLKRKHPPFDDPATLCESRV